MHEQTHIINPNPYNKVAEMLFHFPAGLGTIIISNESRVESLALQAQAWIADQGFKLSIQLAARPYPSDEASVTGSERIEMNGVLGGPNET